MITFVVCSAHTAYSQRHYGVFNAFLQRHHSVPSSSKAFSLLGRNCYSAHTTRSQREHDACGV
ncbi:hypothetical protein DPMN_000904 [Dreissena polymorpha]|uniref:Uncharacterized protein n=1 Tax=Dreissena polymorpha TaxID=45954 RepID=A0A9D4RQD3_DREPO|nr:hypothetical protein DPMN_000904 [Dreissena polymorpha]